MASLVVGFLFLVFLIRPVRNGLAFRKMLSTRLKYSGNLPPLPLVKGLLTEDDLPGGGNPAPANIEANELPPAKETERLIEMFQKVPEPLLKNMEKEIPLRVTQGFSQLRPPASVPDFIDLESQNHHSMRTRKTANTWYGFARYMLHCGKPELALQTLCGILLFAQQLEANPGNAGLTMIQRMFSLAIMRIGARGLLEIMPHLHLPGNTFRLWTKRLLDLEKQTASMTTALKCERNILPSMLSVYAKRNPNHSGVQSLIRSLQEDGFLESWISSCYDPLIAAFNEPFPRAMEMAGDHRKKLQEMLTPQGQWGLHWIRYFFRPRTYVAEVFLAITMVNAGAPAVKDDFQTRQIVRGTIIALGLTGFRKDKGKLPADLAELASWVGQPLPDDPISGSPFHYQPRQDPILFSSGIDLIADNADDLVYVRKGNLTIPSPKATPAKDSHSVAPRTPKPEPTSGSQQTRVRTPAGPGPADQNPSKSAGQSLLDFFGSASPSQPTPELLEKVLIETLTPAMNGGEMKIEKMEILGFEGRWAKVRMEAMGATCIEYFFFEKGKWQYANLIGGMNLEMAKQLRVPESLWLTPKELVKEKKRYEEEEPATPTSRAAEAPNSTTVQQQTTVKNHSDQASPPTPPNKLSSPSEDKQNTGRITLFSQISPKGNDILKKILCPDQPDRVLVVDTFQEVLDTPSELIILVLPEALKTPLSQPAITSLRERKILGIGYGAAEVFGSLGLLIGNGACAHHPSDLAKEMVIDSDTLCPGMKGRTLTTFQTAIPSEKSVEETDDHIAMYIHKKSQEAEFVQTIALMTTDANYAPIVRQGNHLLIGIAALPQDWTEDYRAFFGILANALAKQPNVPFTKPRKIISKPGTSNFQLAPDGSVSQQSSRKFSFRFSRPTKFTATLSIRDSASVMLLFSGPNKELWTRKNGQAGDELQISVNITEEDRQKIREEFWALRVTNFDKEQEAGCELTIDY